MNEDPDFLTVDDVLELHDDAIERYGGDSGLRDRGLLEAAVAMPRQSFDGKFLHADIFEMAAAYTFHLAQNQAFVDGNKRTALAAAYMFLALNGYRLSENEDRLYRAIIALSAHELDKSGLAQILREDSRPDDFE